MLLYDRKDDNIEVYSLNPKKEEIKAFRKKEMGKIPVDERVLRAESMSDRAWDIGLENAYWFHLVPYRLDHRNGWKKDDWNKVYDHEIGIASYEMSKEEKQRQRKLLKSYYEGLFSSHGAIKVLEHKKWSSSSQERKYYLFTSFTHYFDGPTGAKHVMNDIISMTKPLYLLQLLESGSFTKLRDEDISKQLELFNLSDSMIATISLSELRKADEFGLSYGLEGNVIRRAEESQIVLGKIR